MFPLFFDNDGNVCSNLPGDSFGRKMKVRRSGNADLHATRSGLQIPIALCTGISLHVDAPGGGMGGYIIRCVLNFHLATRCISLDPAPRMRNANDAQDGFDADIAFHVRNRDIAGRPGGMARFW